jgi:hypothetical protein
MRPLPRRQFPHHPRDLLQPRLAVLELRHPGPRLRAH